MQLFRQSDKTYKKKLLLLVIPTIFATLISQIFNLMFGFYFYGKNVFQLKILNRFHLLKYLLLHLFLWNINWTLIKQINSYGISKNITSILLITPIALLSYFIQKVFIFRN